MRLKLIIKLAFLIMLSKFLCLIFLCSFKAVFGSFSIWHMIQLAILIGLKGNPV